MTLEHVRQLRTNMLPATQTDHDIYTLLGDYEADLERKAKDARAAENFKRQALPAIALGALVYAAAATAEALLTLLFRELDVLYIDERFTTGAVFVLALGVGLREWIRRDTRTRTRTQTADTPTTAA